MHPAPPHVKDTSTPPGWCRPFVWGCWGWGRTGPWVACCWRYCPVSCFWHTAAASSVPTHLLGWCRTLGRAGPEEQAVPQGLGLGLELGLELGPQQGWRREWPLGPQGLGLGWARWRSWCGRGSVRSIQQHGSARVDREAKEGQRGLTKELARHQGERLWSCWHNLPLRRKKEKAFNTHYFKNVFSL